MAYDEALAAVRIARRTTDVARRRCSALTFMVSGNMCCGVHGEDLIIRLDRDTVAEICTAPMCARGIL